MSQFLVELEDGRKFHVESDVEPTEDDINDFMSPPAAAPAPVSAPSETFLGQSAQKLATGTRQALAGAKTTLSAATGFNETAGRGLSELAAAGQQSQDERTPQDIAFANEMAQNAKEFDAASGVMGQAGEFLDYAGIAARNPRAAFQMGLQSVPNALISIPAAAAGKAIGASAGLMAGIESGPGAVVTGGLGMAAGSIGANILMEGGGAIADKISTATNGASANWTPEQFTAFIDANPDIVKAGLKSGVVRGGVIGTVDTLSMGLAGRVMKPAMGASSRAAMAARGAAATGIEMGSEGAGEALAGYVDTGKVDSEAVAQEMLGGPMTAYPSALVGKSLSAIRPSTAALAPVADPLAAAAANFTPNPAEAPAVAPATAGPAGSAPIATQPADESSLPPTVESRSWNVELSDGRKFIVDSDIEPTVEDIETFLASPDAEAIGPAPAITEESSVVESTAPQVSESSNLEPETLNFKPSSPPLATRQVPVIEDAPYGGQDILDFVNDSPIIIPETARGGDMDWAEKAGLPKNYSKFLAITGETSNINEIAQDAFDANLIDDPTPDALMGAIQSAIDSRESYKADAKSQQSQMNEAEKARILFDKAVARAAKAKTGTQRIEIDAMNKGDTLTLGGEPMTVVAQEVNEDGFNTSVTLRSESGRLGTVTLTADSPALPVESYTPRPSPYATAPNAGSDWADGVIAASMETPFIGIDPQLMAAYAVKGAQLIREGFTTFTQWSAEMIRRFGKAVRDYLQDVWASAMKNSEQGFLAGPRAFMSEQRRRSLDTAKAMAAAGKSSAEIRALTGWFPGNYDGKLRWEGSDERAIIKGLGTADELVTRAWNNVTRKRNSKAPTAELQDILRHPALYEAYPEAMAIPIIADPRMEALGSLVTGMPGFQSSVIQVRADLKGDKLKSTLLHEIQHWIQDQEGFAKGSNPDQFPTAQDASDAQIIARKLEEGLIPTAAAAWMQSNLGRNPSMSAMVLAMEPASKRRLLISGDKDAYRRTAGEIESRDVQARRDFTDEQRTAIAPYSSENIAPEDAIVMFGETGPQMSMETAPEDTVSLTQGAVAAKREAEGKPALPTGNQFTVDALKAEAAAAVQVPGRAQAVLNTLKAEQRPHTPLEFQILQNYAGALDAELAEVNSQLADPATPPEIRASAAARKYEADRIRDDIEVIGQISGSLAGAALGVRRFTLNRSEIPPLAKMVADMTLIMDPTGQTPLPPEERAKIETMHTNIVEAKAKADQQEEEGVAGAKNTYNLELDKLLQEARAQIAADKAALEQAAKDLANAAKPRPQAIKDKGILKIVADRGAMARERLRAKGFFGGTTNMGIDPSIILDLAEAGMGFLAEGADFTIRMVQEFGEKVRPFLGQIRDKAEQLLKEETKRKTVGDVKAKAQDTVRRTGKAPDNLARQFALAHITDHLDRSDKTLSAEKITKLVTDDLQEFFPGIQERQARDLISGYGKSSQPSKEEARVQMRDLSAQMQKLTQLEALLNREPLLKSGPQRQDPSPRLRELQKQVEQLKRDTGYQSRSREDELKSSYDRIQKQLQNQIEELQRVLAGQATPTAPKQRVIYDANLQALQTLRNSLQKLVAELPQHRLASEKRRNAAAEAAARASEAEYKRRIAAKEWKSEGKIQGPQTQAVTEAREAAAVARQNFLDLKRAANPAFNPDVRELANFKRRLQKQINTLKDRIAKGEFDPPKRTPRQLAHDEETAKLLTALNKAKRDFIDAKVAAKFAKMGLIDKAIEKLRWLVFTARSLMAGGEFSGIGRQGLLKALSHPVRFIGDLKAMKQAFKSEQGETDMFTKLYARTNALNGRYKRAKLALHNPDDYSDLLAEGAARSKFANSIPWFSHTGRAYTALLSHMRADLFDALVAKYEKRTKAEISDTAAAAIAEFVNDSTGSGKLGIGKMELRGNQKDLASLLLFSPSFLASRFRVLTGASLLGGNFETRRIIVEEYTRILAGYAALFALAAALQGDDEEEMEMDPRGGGWLKMDYGATSVDLMAGLNSMATFLTRTITGETKTKDGIKAIRGEDADMGQSWIDIAQRFARGKLSPGAGFAVNRLTGTDALGRKETALQGVQRMVTPITFGAAWDIGMEEPANRSAALIPAAFLGVGTNTKRPTDASFFKDIGLANYSPFTP